MPARLWPEGAGEAPQAGRALPDPPLRPVRGGGPRRARAPRGHCFRAAIRAASARTAAVPGCAGAGRRRGLSGSRKRRRAPAALPCGCPVRWRASAGKSSGRCPGAGGLRRLVA